MKLLFASTSEGIARVAGGQGDQEHLWTDADIRAMTPEKRKKYRRVKGGWRKK